MSRLLIIIVATLLFLFALWIIAQWFLTPYPPYTKSQVNTYLTKGWAGYKMKFILADGRVIRPENNNDTVSEGQAYAMLLAVYLNDQNTFDKCFQWTEQNLSRTLPGSSAYGGPDNLLAWHWVPGMGIKENKWNSASDADGDYAFALLLAYEKWGNSQYLSKALAVMQDILSKETYAPTNLEQTHLLYLKPGNWGEDVIYSHQGIVINPSYFSPYWYRKFNQYLSDTRWQMLIDGCYQILQSAAVSIKNPNSKDIFNGVGLMPDWAFVDNSGNVYFREDALKNVDTTLSGWDAFRTSWRVYFDLNATRGRESRASNYLNQLFNFYQQQFNAGKPIFATYYYSGTPATDSINPAASGVPLLTSSLDFSLPITQQTGIPQIALSYILRSAPTNPPLNNQYGNTNTFQDYGNYGYFIAPGDVIRYYINSWCMLGLLIASHTPEPTIK